MAKLYCDTNLQGSLFSPLSNTKQRALFLKGSSQQVENQLQEYLRMGRIDYYESLRIDIDGITLKESNCCFVTCTLIGASMCLLPIFAVCTDCWKQKANQIKQVKQETYRSISKILQMGNFMEFFLMVNDNLMSQRKIELLIQGVRGRVRNLMLINKAQSFNVVANNYSESPRYFRRLLHEVRNGQCRWQKDIQTNISLN